MLACSFRFNIKSKNKKNACKIIIIFISSIRYLSLECQKKSWKEKIFILIHPNVPWLVKLGKVNNYLKIIVNSLQLVIGTPMKKTLNNLASNINFWYSKKGFLTNFYFLLRSQKRKKERLFQAFPIHRQR
jgi:hypothetical protein